MADALTTERLAIIRHAAKHAGDATVIALLDEVERLQAEVDDPLLRKQRDNWKAVSERATEERDEVRAALRDVIGHCTHHPADCDGTPCAAERVQRAKDAVAERDRLAATVEELRELLPKIDATPHGNDPYHVAADIAADIRRALDGGRQS